MMPPPGEFVGADEFSRRPMSFGKVGGRSFYQFSKTHQKRNQNLPEFVGDEIVLLKMNISHR